MAWKIETKEKKSVVDIEYYSKTTKSGKELKFSREIGYRWGYVIVNEDPREAYTEAQEENEPLRVTGFDVIDHSYEDGCWSDNIGIDKLPKREQTKLEDTNWPEDAGWECADSDTYFHGPLTIVKVSDNYPHEEITD